MLRQQTKPTSRVHAVITDGGQKPNIIPERSELNIYMRGLTDDDTLDLTEKVKNCARGAATATGMLFQWSKLRCFDGNQNLHSLIFGLRSR